MSLQPLPHLDIRRLYDQFDAPVTDVDCGAQCAPHNPRGIPFCCDICQAVPAVYRQEWAYLQHSTDLWHIWRGDECPSEPGDPAELSSETPAQMLLLACQGPARCQRPFRALSCRQFPFFPYISGAGRFIGLAYDWEYEASCWVINRLERVSAAFRREFVQLYDQLLAQWLSEYESYANLSEQMRTHFAARRRRIPLLHRNGRAYLISPCSERLQRVAPERLPWFGPYRR